MISPTKSAGQIKRKWTTINAFEVGDRFFLEEKSKHDAARHFAEMGLCFIAGVLLLGCYLLFIMPEFVLLNTYSGISLPVMMIGIAIVLYAFATRGFKPQVGLDRAKKQFWMCKLNSRGHARITTYFPKKDVQSVFVQRPEGPAKNAALRARIKGKAGPITLLRGNLADIEAAHQELCEVLRDSGATSPAKSAATFGNLNSRPKRLFGAKAN